MRTADRVRRRTRRGETGAPMADRLVIQLPLWLLGVVVLGGAGGTAFAADAPEGIAFFEQKVRPLLVAKCYECHAADAKKIKGDLLLDTKAGWVKGGEAGPVIVPGKPDESLLIQAVRYDHATIKMPPKGKLATAEIDALVQWVTMGAPDPREGAAPEVAAPNKGIDIQEGKKLWSLRPLKRSEPPAVKDASWAKTRVDRFILAKLEEKGIAPNVPVDRRKLIRRAYFDLIGLPPAPKKVEAFVADPDPAAYEKLVDELLASPRYGERWASYWLDVVRFAESDGFEHDYDRPHAYHYRDFVIQAINDDLPYDRFVKWQLAGDEYEPDNAQAMMATGFLTAGVFPTQITEKEFESTRYNQLDDMVATTGIAFLGLTVGCARCHDHKFDPIPAVDYYRMASVFTTAIRNDVELDLLTPQQRAEAEIAFEAKRKELTAQVELFERDQPAARFDQFIASVKQRGGVAPSAWSVLDVADIKTGGTKFTKLPDGSLLKTGPDTPATDTYTFTARTDATGITAIRLEALAHESLPKNGPGLAPNGNFVLGALEITAAHADGSGQPVELTVTRATATHQQDAGELSVAATLDEDPKTGWAVDNGGIGKDQAAVFEFDEPAGFPGGTVLTFRMRFEHPNTKHAIGRPRLSISTHAPIPPVRTASAVDFIPADIATTLNALAKSEPVDPAQADKARRWFLTTLPEYQQLRAALASHEAAGPAKRSVKVQVTSEGLPPVKNHADDRGYPHFYPQTYVLRRGDPNQKVEPAQPSFLQVLMPGDKPDPSRWLKPPPPGARTSHRRRALAEWVTDVEQGAGALAARVAVNRLWQHHVGRGIVSTPSDFGTRGAPPTHPELLDHLASRLVQEGWRLKPIHRLIMLSATYQAASAFDPAKAAVDPDNLLFWRRPVRRLESESIRDTMLSVAGMLDTTMYGPGTLDPASRRRSVYFTVKRSSLIPMMTVFDAPEALTPMAERATTTIAPQALLLMNNPQVREYAKALAKRAAPDESVAPDAAVRAAYAIALSRAPSAEELSDAVSFITGQSDAYAKAGRSGAKELALADFCQALMCLNEFVYAD
jgi:mono/diheme cytochrome c family protein